MTKYRALNEQEKKLVTQNLITLQEDVEYYDAMVRKSELNLELAPLVYKQQIRQMQSELAKLKQELEVGKNTVKTLEKQLNVGVEIKPASKNA